MSYLWYLISLWLHMSLEIGPNITLINTGVWTPYCCNPHYHTKRRSILWCNWEFWFWWSCSWLHGFIVSKKREYCIQFQPSLMLQKLNQISNCYFHCLVGLPWHYPMYIWCNSSVFLWQSLQYACGVHLSMLVTWSNVTNLLLQIPISVIHQFIVLSMEHDKLRMMGVPVKGPANVFCDNQSVFKNCSFPESTLKKKHNAIAYHRVR
jgi:hypothetical protein